MITGIDESLDDLFVEEIPPAAGTADMLRLPWKVMIVDDEPAIHDVTKLALQGATFDKRPLQFISCYSAAEARQAIAEHPDTALILLDVVMESEHAGLEFARFVREGVDNPIVRIVLRTGQPGQAPERQVIVDYDINDYKEKTELTAAKLFTLMYASLRAYRDIITIESNKRALAKIIDASSDIFKLSSIERFAQGVLEQISSLISSCPGTLFLTASCKPDGLAACYDANGWRRVAGCGRYVGDVDPNELLMGKFKHLLDQAATPFGIAHDDHALLAHFEDRLGGRNLLLLDGLTQLGETELGLIEMYMRNVSIALENISLHEDLESTQSEIIYLLGEAVETRSEETGGHVRRVAELSHFLALALGLSENEADVLKAASPLHDLGKIGISDMILHKPGRLTPEEREIMCTHADIGYNLLKQTKRQLLQVAAVIAHEHHEWWNGEGYPQGKKGTDIDLFARITAVTDVYDALLNERSYKKAWTNEAAISFMKESSGSQFDPEIVDALVRNLDAVNDIRARFSDANVSNAPARDASPFMLPA